MTTLTWGDGIYQASYGDAFARTNLGSLGVDGRIEVLFEDAVGPQVRFAGRTFFDQATDPTPSAPFYPSTPPPVGDPPGASYTWNLGSVSYALLVGAKHDGSTLMDAGDWSRVEVTGVPASRPYYTAGGKSVPRFSVGPIGPIAGSVPTEFAGAEFRGRLFTSLFDSAPPPGYTPTVSGTPAAGATQVTLGGLAPRVTDLFDTNRFAVEGALHAFQTAVVRLAGDPVRYRLSYQSFSDYSTSPTSLTFNIDPALQASTAQALDDGATGVEWLPRPEIPTSTPFDILLLYQDLVRTGPEPGSPSVSAGRLCRAELYYHYHEPRSWYSEG